MKITIEDIRKLGPCYDPSRYLPEDWTGTVYDILHLEDCPAADRIWLALNLLPRDIVEVYAIDCAFAAYVSTNSTDSANEASAADVAYADAAHAISNVAYAAYSDFAYVASTNAAFAVAGAYATVAYNQERENQIDALLMLIGDEG